MKVTFLLGIALAILFASAVQAQFSQYTSPGDRVGASTDQRDALFKDLQDARWKWGRFRLQPRFSLKNFAYLDDVFLGSGGDSVADLTATVGAGINAYLPLGNKALLAAFALPEYTWWRDLKDRRSFNDRYGAGFFGYFNRLTLELEASTVETQSFVSSEVEQLTTSQQDRLQGHFAIGLNRSLWLFATASSVRYGYLSGEEAADPRIARFDRLDRDEDLAAVGLRVRLRGDWTLSGGFERSQVRFLNPDNDLSNDGSAPFVRVNKAARRSSFFAEAHLRSLEAREGSRFQKLEEVTGATLVTLQVRPKTTVYLRGQRTLLYSVSAGFSTALEDRYGLTVRQELGGRTDAELFVEAGQQDFIADQAGLKRVDDYRAWGGLFEWAIRPKLSLRLGLTHTEFDSNLPGFDRDTTRWTTSLRFAEAAWP